MVMRRGAVCCLPSCIRMQALQIRLRGAICFDVNQAGRIKFDVVRIDDYIHPFQRPQFLDLRGRKCCLRCATSPHYHHLANLALAQLLQRMVGDIGFLHGIRRQDQHARHIHRDVAVADHDGPLTGEVNGQIAIIRMPIIPAYERESWKGIGQLFARDAHTSISLCANRIDDLIVELLEFRMMDIDTISTIN